ncbi:MAG TPA: SAM-dependent methyltransferase, partial [Chloroflexota bacterium]
MQSPQPAGDDRAYLDFVLGLKQHFARDLYPRLRGQYDERLRTARTSDPAEPARTAQVVESLPAYAWFQWLERNPQKMMWRRLEAMLEPREEDLATRLDSAVPNPLGSLELDPNLKLPDYYTATEFHIQPGGVWSGATNTFVYEVGARIVMMGANDD